MKIVLIINFECDAWDGVVWRGASLNLIYLAPVYVRRIRENVDYVRKTASPIYFYEYAFVVLPNNTLNANKT